MVDAEMRGTRVDRGGSGGVVAGVVLVTRGTAGHEGFDAGASVLDP